MNHRKSATVLLLLTLLSCRSLAAQIEFRRQVPGGLFQVPAFWTPFDPANFPPILGPGGVEDSVLFNLGMVNRYTIENVNGVNRKLIVDNDAICLEIVDYELFNPGLLAIEVGSSPFDTSDIVFSGTNDSELRSGNVSIGNTPNSIGVVTVEGPGFSWESGSIVVGEFGTGTLEIAEGAVLTSSNAILGFNIIGNGTVNVDGSGGNTNWNIQGNLNVGFIGTGDLTIEDGANVAVDNVTTISVVNASSIGVDGSGSHFSSNSIDVGGGFFLLRTAVVSTL